MKYLVIFSMIVFGINAQAKSLKSIMNDLVKQASAGPTVDGKTSNEGNKTISSFSQAKKLMKSDSRFYVETLYCGCKIEGKTSVNATSCGYVPPTNKKGTVSSRAGKIEYEHLAAAESFGQSFKEWRDPKGICGAKYTGRKCAEKNKEFARMEADLHNLWAEDGLTNLLRSNKTHQALTSSEYSFGKCDIKLTSSGFTARPDARGTIARTLKYMDWAYPGRGVISEKNRPLYDAWDKMHKATPMECAHHAAAAQLQGNPNPFTVTACKAAGLKY